MPTQNGNARNNKIVAGPLGDLLRGFAGEDTLLGGIGIDTLVGGLGNDILGVQTTTDIVTELVGGGVDTVRSSLISVSLNVVAARTQQQVAPGPPKQGIPALVPVSTLWNDALYGYLGVDVMTGGRGADRFLFDPFSFFTSEEDVTAGMQGDRIVDSNMAVTSSTFRGTWKAAVSSDWPVFRERMRCRWKSRSAMTGRRASCRAMSMATGLPTGR